MSHSKKDAPSSTKPESGAFELKASFTLALITLLLVLGFFVQSFRHIHETGVVVIGIERLEERVATSDSE